MSDSSKKNTSSLIENSVVKQRIKKDKDAMIAVITWSGTWFTAIIVICFALIAAAKEIAAGRKSSSLHKVRNPTLYGVDFLESVYPPLPEKKLDYTRRVRIGYEEMKKLRVVVTSVALNDSIRFQKNFLRLEKLSGFFKDFRVVIVDPGNDTDISNLLEDQSRRNSRFTSVKVESPLFNNTKPGLFDAKRVEEMARLRNSYLKHIRENYSDYDYVFVIDSGLDGPFSIDGIANCFSYKEWDSMNANGLASRMMTGGRELGYYDITSLVLEKDKPIPITSRKTLVNYAKQYMSLSFYRGEPPIKVQSGFGGMAIYKMQVILDKDVVYSGIYNEHVSYHLSMIKKGYDKIYIQPSLVALSVSNVHL